MNFRDEKFVRFQDLGSEQSFNSERTFSDEKPLLGRVGRTLSSVSSSIQRSYRWGYGGIRKIQKSFQLRSPSDLSTERSGPSKKVFDPQGKFIQRWNKIFVLSCVLAIYLDPLFFYIPVMNENCLDVDHKLEITACVLRSFTDIFYVLHIFFKFRTGFIAPSSRVFGRGVLVEDLQAIASRYLLSYFFIDVLAVLPLPQVLILGIIPKLRGSVPLYTKNALRFVIMLQYIPRLARIVPLYRGVISTTGIITETAWAGAAINLLLYMLASHVIGAFYYLLAIERQDTCWREACQSPLNACDLASLYCGKHDEGKTRSFLVNACPVNTDNGPFDFGIYQSVLEADVVQSRNFPEKLFYCFWWGLQNLSSLGQNLKTSTYIWEICFAVFISISGLVLFALLIGNMQTYLQSATLRLEEMRVKRRDAEQWMSHRMLPDSLRERIRRYDQYKWLEFRGVNEEDLIRNLPRDLRRDIKRHLCLALLMRVPMFNNMDDQLLDAMCDRLKPSLHTEDSYIVREGDPVDEMLFIMRGKLESVTTNGGRTGFFNSDFLKEGDFCGEELLTWALDPNPSASLPSSTRTVKALSEVEAFALTSDDLRFVAKQFRRLHSKQLRHTFRFYSQHWRTWAACFIQAAWRRYCKRKLEESLHREEDRLQAALAENGGGGYSPSLGATIYASRFAANALRVVRTQRKMKLLARSPLIKLPKPAEPNFAVDDD
ncbi:unnamed protein product [Victoria cruziana]